MKRFFKYLFLVFLMLTVVTGCATFKRMSTEEKVTLAYVTAGESMKGVHATWLELRTAGKVSDEQNVKFNELFNKAKGIYATMGTTEIAVLTAASTAEKEGNIVAFNEAANKLPEILLEIQNLITLIKGGKQSWKMNRDSKLLIL